MWRTLYGPLAAISIKVGLFAMGMGVVGFQSNSNSWMSVKFGLMPIHEGSGWGNMITDGPSTPLSNPSHLIIFLFMYIHMYILNWFRYPHLSALRCFIVFHMFPSLQILFRNAMIWGCILTVYAPFRFAFQQRSCWRLPFPIGLLKAEYGNFMFQCTTPCTTVL